MFCPPSSSYILQISITGTIPLSLQFFCLNARTASLGTTAMYFLSLVSLLPTLAAFHFGATSFPFDIIHSI